MFHLWYWITLHYHEIISRVNWFGWMNLLNELEPIELVTNSKWTSFKCINSKGTAPCVGISSVPDPASEMPDNLKCTKCIVPTFQFQVSIPNGVYSANVFIKQKIQLLNKIAGTRDYENDRINNRNTDAFSGTSVIKNVCDPLGTDTSATKCSIDQGLTRVLDSWSVWKFNFSYFWPIDRARRTMHHCAA